MELTQHYDPKASEEKWQSFWEEQGIYRFNPKDTEKEIYSIDTPPPTESGKMHLGHAFSYTQADIIARFQRMLGKNVFFPFGTDDNGIPTERLVEQLKNVRANRMERQEFIALCLDTLDNELRPKYLQDWKRIGMSCDWSIVYSTIDEHSRRISQRSFIDLFNKGRTYRKQAPVIWDPVLQTALSQVELKDEEKESTFSNIAFKTSDGEDVIIATTRPELLCACVAVFAHPDDARYQMLIGKELRVPVYHFSVKVLADKRVDPDKGTGIVMCCTFGDQTDIEWYKAFNLDLKVALTKDGRMTAIAGKYHGMAVNEARTHIIADMQESGELIKQERIVHTVNVGERSGAEIEILETKQWFISYLDLKDDMLKWGKALNWYPEHMKVRYEHWVKGLSWDWLISRQRCFGVPFPVWYCKDCDAPILAKEDDLPVDPLTSKPPIKKCEACGCSEFIPEQDVLDTWATSSLTPQIATELMKGTPAYDKLYPMSLRPQAHDIITFWLFNTVVKSQLHHGIKPWRDVVISGHAQDPHRKKMSKSKGNVVEPQGMIAEYSADALRFWAAGSRLGDDLPFQEKDMVTGKKFITKLWNASKFSFMHLKGYTPEQPEELEAIDKWIISKANGLIKGCTYSMQQYEYARTRLDVEAFFWHLFCDQYLEIVKDRLYNPGERGENAKASAQFALFYTLNAILKLIAPVMPHITEELYQAYFKEWELAPSIHNAAWPSGGPQDEEAELLGDFAVRVVHEVRKAKAQSNKSMKDPVRSLKLKGRFAGILFDKIKDDLAAATKADTISFEEIDEGSEQQWDCVVEV